MPIPSQTIPLPFATGLQQKTDPRYVDAGAQSSIVNGQFTKGMAITKRWGFTALAVVDTDGNDVTSGSKLGALTNVLTMCDGHTLYTYSATASKYVNVDRMCEPVTYHSGVVEWPSAINSFSIAYVNGYTITAWSALPYNSTTAYAIFASVQDSSGNYIFRNYNVTNVAGIHSFVKVIAVGNYAIVVYKDGIVTTDIYAIALDTTTLTWSSAVKIVSDYDAAAASQGFWDICKVSSTQWAILYPSHIGASRATGIKTLDTTPSVVASTTFGPAAGYNSPGHGYAIDCANSSIWTAVVYDDGFDSRVYIGIRNASTLGQTLAETNLGHVILGQANRRIAIKAATSTQAYCAHSTTVEDGVGVRWGQMSSSGSTSGTNRQLFLHTLASKIFIQGDRAYCGVACTVNLTANVGVPPTTTIYPQGAWICLDLDVSNTTSTQQAGRPVAINAPRIANTTALPYTSLVQVTEVSRVDSSTLVGVISTAGSGSTRYDLRALTYDFAYPTRWQNAELGEVVYQAGGIMTMFDGQRVSEVGFLHPPPSYGAVSSNGAGSLTNSGTYTYLVWYEWADAKGNIQRSAASANTVSMGAADDTVTLTIKNLSNTLKQDVASTFDPPVKIQIARTANGGSTFYLLQSDGGAITSNPNTGTQTYVDLVSDASLNGLGFGQWWASGGLLEAYTPSSALGVLVHNNRIWYLTDDQITWGYSTEYIAGEQVRFNDQLRLSVPDGGPTTGWASMDGALIVFKRNSIFVVRGSGSNETGTSSDLSVPQQIPSEVGCIDPRSVCVTSMGTFFQSVNGIYLLDRNLQVQYFGAPVEDMLSDNPVIRRVTLVPRRQEVRFECVPSETSTTGVTLVYSTFFHAWMQHQRYDPDQSLASCATQDAIVVNGQYYWLTSGGRIYQENTDETMDNAFTDAGRWVTLTIESANAKSGLIAGWARFRYAIFTCEQNSPFDLTVSVAQDYGSYAQTSTYLASSIATWSGPLKTGKLQIGPNQKAAALKVKLSDAQPTGYPIGTGQGPTYVALALDIAAYPGRYRIPPAQGA